MNLSPSPRLRVPNLNKLSNRVEAYRYRYATGIPFSRYQYGQGASFSTRLTKSLTGDGSTTTRSFWVIKDSFNAIFRWDEILICDWLCSPILICCWNQVNRFCGLNAASPNAARFYSGGSMGCRTGLRSRPG